MNSTSDEEQEWHEDGCDVGYMLGGALVGLTLTLAFLLLWLAFHLPA